VEFQWLEFGIGAGLFLIAVVTTLVGVGWRIRGMEARLREESRENAEQEAFRAMKKHLDAEHTKDSEGRTLRERIGLVEATCKQRHPQIGG